MKWSAGLGEFMKWPSGLGETLESDKLKVENLGNGGYCSGIEIYQEKFSFVIWGEIHRANQPT